MTDQISLTIPSGVRFRGVATLVLGGVGSRLDLPYERVDDLQLAVLSALEASNGERVTVEVLPEQADLVISIGPLAQASESDDALARVLEPLVDGFETGRRDGRVWLTLRLHR